MRQEQLFSDGGYYRFLLDSNVLLHREAVAATYSVLSDWLTAQQTSETLRVLDLACGGMPVTVCSALARLAPHQIAYTGIDINADQVRAARTFVHPTNVVDWRVVEGSAWELPQAVTKEHFDIVYSGMNLHHATAEELQFLAQQLGHIMAPNGVFISHDVYRPNHERYVQRPAVNPRDPSESFRLVDIETLARAGIGESPLNDHADAQHCAWREDYLDRMRETLLARGADPNGVRETVAHMRERDFPVSVAELSELFRRAGFAVRQLQLNSGEPLAPYVSLIAAVCSPQEG
jgi:SAM-dependent methyltransferase